MKQSFSLGLIPLVLLACTGDNVIEKQANTAPTILIASHSDGVEVLDGYAENFRASVSDDDNEFNELLVAWYVGENIVCDWAEVSPAGESFCEIVFVPGDRNVIAEVRDPQGAGGRAEITLTVQETSAPTAQILSPATSNGFYSNELIQFSALVGDNEDALDDLIVTWTSNIDGELILDTTPDSSGLVSDYTYLSEGQHALELRVEDSSGKVTKEQMVLQVAGANVPPSCEILSPTDMDAVILGDSVLFRGQVNDDNIPATDLTVMWRSDKDGDLGSGTLNSQGGVSLAYDGLSANDHVISLFVEDEVGASCQATIFLFVGEAPTATIVAPGAGDVFAVGESIIFQGAVTDSEDQPNEIAITWTSSIDGVLQSGVANSQGISQFSRSDLTAGLHTISFEAVDSTGLIADEILTFRVNTPPTTPSITLNPNPVLSTQTLTATAMGSTDADGNNVTYLYQWFENGVATSVNGSSVPASELDVGEVWTVRVTPNDGYMDGNFAEASITISNSNPTLSNTIISSSDGANFYNTSVVTCSATAVDADETVTPTYSWNIGGGMYNGSSVDLSNYNILPDTSITCTVSVNDSHGGSASSSASTTLDNRAPVLQSPSISPSPTYSNGLLTCTGNATDADGENPQISYEWFLGTASLGNQSTLQLSSSMVSPNDIVECVVTAMDGFGASDSASTSVSIQNSLPSLSNTSLTPTEPTLNDTITCTASASDIDGDTPVLGFVFSNQSSGATYSATTTSSNTATLDISSTNASYNDVLACEITATDADGGSATNTLTVSIVNTSPVFTQGAVISPSANIYEGTLLTCNATATDPDDGVASLSYTWAVNGTQVATGANWTVNGNDAVANDSITCTAIAVDFTGNSTTSTSVAVTMLNSPPVLTSTTLNSLNVYTNDTLSVSVIASDLEGDTINYGYEWHVVDASNNNADGIVSAGMGSSFASLSGSNFDRDDEVYVVVTASDAFGVGNALTSDSAMVQNSVPTAPNISLTGASNPPMEAIDDLTCSIANVATDLDGDPLTYTYEWLDPSGSSYINTANSTAQQDVFPGIDTVGGTWTCEVTVSDGTDSAVATTTIEVDSAWAGLITFDNCGQTGQTGPSQSQCDSNYATTLLAGEVTVTNGYQFWTVPSTGTYLIEAYGAKGGAAGGGYGAMMSGEFLLQEGEVLKILVGQKGHSHNNASSGGGGGTFVTYDSNIPLIIAGGGAGGINGYNGDDGVTTENSSQGRNYGLGLGGRIYNTDSLSTSHGSGGAGLIGNGEQGGVSQTALSFTNGGTGASGYTGGWGGFGGGGGYHNSGSNVGGGGGGYTGGHGNWGYNTHRAGGGGSYNVGSNQSNFAGVNADHGYVIIDRL